MADFTPPYSREGLIYDYGTNSESSQPQYQKQPLPQINSYNPSREAEKINPQTIQLRSYRKQKVRHYSNNSSNVDNKDQSRINQRSEKLLENNKICLHTSQSHIFSSQQRTKSLSSKFVYQTQDVNIHEVKVCDQEFKTQQYEEQYQKQEKFCKNSSTKRQYPPNLSIGDQNQSDKFKSNLKSTIGTDDSIKPSRKNKNKSSSLTVSTQQLRLKRNPVIIQDRYQNVLTHVVPPGYKIVCQIKMQAKLFGLSTQYFLFLKEKGDHIRPILSAKKQMLNLSSSYIISKNYEYSRISKRQVSCIGILRANFFGTQYRYHKKLMIDEISRQQSQQLKCIIKYQSNILGYKGPKELQVIKPKPTLKNTFQNSLQQIINNYQQKKLQIINNIKPTKKTKNGMFIIDFKGNAKVPSGRNFILASKRQKQCLLFAKQSNDCFLMEVSYPLNLSEAFAICLSSLDSKILCN